MRDTVIGKMSRELRSEGQVVLRPNFLNREGKMVSDFVQELHCGLRVVVIAEAHYAETRDLVDGRNG